MQQEEATGHDDPATICVTGAVAIVVFIERQESWEAATAFWSEDKADEDEAHGESDASSDHDSDPSGDDNSSGGEGSASSPTDDGFSEEVIAMSQRTKHVHKKKRPKLAQWRLAVARSSV